MVSREVVRLAAEIASRKPLAKESKGYIVMRHRDKDGISVVDRVPLAEVNRMLQEAWDKVMNDEKEKERAAVQLGV